MSGKVFVIFCIVSSILLIFILFPDKFEDYARPILTLSKLIGSNEKANGPTTTTANNGIAGESCEGQEGMTPRFSVKFLNDTQVELYADGSKIGDTCTYMTPLAYWKPVLKRWLAYRQLINDL